MNYSKAYLITYNRLFSMTTSKLLEIALISNNKFLEDIAIRILIDDNRLLNIDKPISLNLLIDKLSIEDIWYLSTLNTDSLIVKLAKEKVINIIDNTFYHEKKILYLTK